MCLVAIALDENRRFPLVVAANRDEFFERPTARLGWWTPADCWRRRKLARARLRALLTDSVLASSMPATSLAWNPRTSRKMRTASWRGGSSCRAVMNASEMASVCS